jgi:hypothetical protein
MLFVIQASQWHCRILEQTPMCQCLQGGLPCHKHKMELVASVFKKFIIIIFLLKIKFLYNF